MTFGSDWTPSRPVDHVDDAPEGVGFGDERVEDLWAPGADKGTGLGGERPDSRYDDELWKEGDADAGTVIDDETDLVDDDAVLEPDGQVDAPGPDVQERQPVMVGASTRSFDDL